MAISGRKPKDAALTRHRNPLVHEWIEVLDVAFADGRKLPARQPDGTPWPRWTRRWWSTLSTMPHCTLWAPIDWEFALDTAVLKARFHESCTAAMATEIRNRERVLGTTAEYRRDLRIRYVTSLTPPPVEGVTSLDAYRDL